MNDGSADGRRLDGVNQIRKYHDGTVVRVFCVQTSAEVYSSGWAYSLHYGLLESDPPRTLEDGTIRRYDNAHEDTKGHELHVAPESDPVQIDFPGMVALWQRFWSQIPKPEIDVE